MYRIFGHFLCDIVSRLIKNIDRDTLKKKHSILVKFTFLRINKKFKSINNNGRITYFNFLFRIKQN